MSNETKKQEAPKAAPSASADAGAFPHNLFASFDPMAYWTQSQQAFQKLVSDGYARVQSFSDQYQAIETQMISRAQGTVANWAQLAQDAIAYGAQLSAEARKLGFETIRKMNIGA